VVVKTYGTQPSNGHKIYLLSTRSETASPGEVWHTIQPSPRRTGLDLPILLVRPRTRDGGKTHTLLQTAEFETETPKCHGNDAGFKTGLRGAKKEKMQIRLGQYQ
jgi:hypothetical protein